MGFIQVEKDLVLRSARSLLNIQENFKTKYQVDDIFGNSKVYEIVIANRLNHILIPGHSGTRDVKDDKGNVYEYKHFKESSSNHSWTFNDYSQAIFDKMRKENYMITFAHINDTNGLSRKLFKENTPDKIQFPDLDWYYEVPGSMIADYLENWTKGSTNNRDMANVSRHQIEKSDFVSHPFNCKRYPVIESNEGRYNTDLRSIFDEIDFLEEHTNVLNLLTSNKIWELLTSVHLNHNVNSEQGGRLGSHDAYDQDGNQFEYKIAKTENWNFQDISEAVLKKYESVEAFILAVKNIEKISIDRIYYCDKSLITRIRSKLEEKKEKFRSQGKRLKRLQISLTRNDIGPFITREISV